MWRHQLPAYSPVPLTAAFRALPQVVHLGEDPRPRLSALLQEEFGAAEVLLCGSGTQALTLALRMARGRVDPRAPVALPAFACFDVASGAVGADMGISFYDVDPDTLSPDLVSLERVIRAGAGTAVIAPLYGVPVDWPPIAALAKRYNTVVIEDAAQGNGASLNGQPVGGLGEIATLSFGRAKGWTGGNGGAVLLRRLELRGETTLEEPETSREISNALGLAAQAWLARPAVYFIPLSIPAVGLGQSRYRAPRPVGSITRTAALTLLATHELSRAEACARKANADALLAGMATNRNVRLVRLHTGAAPGFLRLPVRLPSGMASFGSAADALRLGIAPSYPACVADLTQVSALMRGPESAWPGARALVREMVTLPTHGFLRSKDITEIKKSVRAARG